MGKRRAQAGFTGKNRMMELIRGIYNIKPKHYGCVATIGNFDGVHLGHQEVVRRLNAQAKALNLPSLLITFEPLPLEFFLKAQAPARLMCFREKIMFLRRQAVDRVLCLKFNEKLAALAPEDFVKNILVEKLGVRYLLVGDDFKFGKNRRGDFALLQKLGERYGFQVADIATVLCDGQRVGSSRVRSALQQGDLNLAGQLLGRPYSMCGHVIHGDKRGRQLGFPTANILLRRAVAPLSGVFAVRVYGVTNGFLPGVANVGRRPTVDGNKRLLEVYLLNFEGDLYQKFLQIEFVTKLRDEQRFASIDLLKAQIYADVEAAKSIFIH